MYWVYLQIKRNFKLDQLIKQFKSIYKNTNNNNNNNNNNINKNNNNNNKNNNVKYCYINL